VYVARHPEAVWAVGPLFAAFTGVAFKEGVCYGKPECAVLFFLTPALFLGELAFRPFPRRCQNLVLCEVSTVATLP
jgi:uncharacterized integral membrane protein